MVTKPILNTVDIIIILITIIIIKTLSYRISSSTNLRALSARTQRLGGSLGLTNIGTSTETATYSWTWGSSSSSCFGWFVGCFGCFFLLKICCFFLNLFWFFWVANLATSWCNLYQQSWLLSCRPVVAHCCVKYSMINAELIMNNLWDNERISTCNG